jgi:hypothetical protein
LFCACLDCIIVCRRLFLSLLTVLLALIETCSYLTAKALSIVTAEIELEDHETGKGRTAVQLAAALAPCVSTVSHTVVRQHALPTYKWRSALLRCCDSILAQLLQMLPAASALQHSNARFDSRLFVLPPTHNADRVRLQATAGTATTLFGRVQSTAGTPQAALLRTTST